jgi:hypothetical protein
MQPDPSEILLDGTYALMSMKTFDKLKTYYVSHPTPLCLGLMWKVETYTPLEYLLRWCAHCHDGECYIVSRIILVV